MTRHMYQIYSMKNIRHRPLSSVKSSSDLLLRCGSKMNILTVWFVSRISLRKMPSIRETLREMGVSLDQVLTELSQNSKDDSNNGTVPTPLTNYLDVKHFYCITYWREHLKKNLIKWRLWLKQVVRNLDVVSQRWVKKKKLTCWQLKHSFIQDECCNVFRSNTANSFACFVLWNVLFVCESYCHISYPQLHFWLKELVKEVSKKYSNNSKAVNLATAGKSETLLWFYFFFCLFLLDSVLWGNQHWLSGPDVQCGVWHRFSKPLGALAKLLTILHCLL